MSRRSEPIRHLTPWTFAAGCLAVGFLLVRAPQLRAATRTTCAGVTLPANERAFGVDLVLNGMGIRSVTVFGIEVFVAGLYVTRRTTDPLEVMSRDSTRMIVMIFLDDADRSDMIDAIRSGIADQSPRLRQLARTSLPDLERRLPNARKGDRLAYAYSRGRLEMRHNGKLTGSWNDPGFAEALIHTWLGANPTDSDLKKGLLGGECD